MGGVLLGETGICIPTENHLTKLMKAQLYWWVMGKWAMEIKLNTHHHQFSAIILAKKELTGLYQKHALEFPDLFATKACKFNDFSEESKGRSPQWG